MFERYDESATRALFFARMSIAELGGRVIASEHIVRGVLRADADAILRFAKAGTTADTVREQFEREDVAGERLPTSDEVPFSPDAKAALERASVEADDLENAVISPEHLVLGVMVKTSGPAARGLQAVGVEVASVRRYLAARPRDAETIPLPWSCDNSGNLTYEDVVAALHRGDFSWLEPVFARSPETSTLAQWV